MTVCRICGTDGKHGLHKVREMQFGTKDEFIYFECTYCGCLQLRDIPETLPNYYPENYYSFHSIPATKKLSLYQRARKHGLRKIIDHHLNKSSILGALLEKKYGHGFIPYWLDKTGLTLSSDSRILDVGCGSGETLFALACIGFRSLLGVDAFIPTDVAYPNGVKILRSSLESIAGTFDFIMLHHSFEHMKEQRRVLQKLNALLPVGHFALIRIPILSHAWKVYGVNWAQIDAPRHLFLHSIDSIQLLAAQTGFEVSEIIFDSDEFQFWASEQYARDIPLMADNSYRLNPSASIFSAAEIEAYATQARLLNQEKRGDQACIYLRKPS